MARPKFTDKHKTYCKEYVIDFKMGRAYKKVFRCKTLAMARKNASRLMLTNADVRKYIAELLDKQTKRAEKDADAIIRELELLGFSNIGDYLSFTQKGVVLKGSSKLTKEQMAAISEVSEYFTKRGTKRGTRRRSFKLHSKLTALEMLGKHHKLWAEKAGPTINLSLAIHEAMSATNKKRSS